MSTRHWAPTYIDRAVEQFLDRCLGWSVEELNAGWEDVLVPAGISHVAATFQDTRSSEWVERWVSHHLSVPPKQEARYIPSTLGGGERVHGLYFDDYCGNWGFPLIQLASLRDPVRKQAEALARQVGDHIIENSVRGPDEVILHGGFARSVWVDTLYYTAVPLAMLYAETGDRKYGDEAVRQCRLHANYLMDQRTGLFFHDWSPTTGVRSSAFWARGNGWIVMALAETLHHIGSEYDGYDDVLRIYREMVDALLRYRHSSGMWRVVPEDDDSLLETSGTAMILLGLAIGVRLGVLEQSLETVVATGYAELATWIRMDETRPDYGALMGSQRPAGKGGWERHRSVSIGECSYASGVFLKLLSELRKSGII